MKHIHKKKSLEKQDGEIEYSRPQIMLFCSTSFTYVNEKTNQFPAGATVEFACSPHLCMGFL